jgi:tetratricopeptide (TPR) repeat protein
MNATKEILLERAIGAYELNRYPMALDLIQQTLALNPDEAEAHFYRGRILFRQNKLKQAEESFQTAIACDPDDSFYLGYLAFMYSQMPEKQKQAESTYLQSLSINPFETFSMWGLAYYYLQEGKRDSLKKARPLAEDYLETFPDKAHAHRLMGDLLEKEKKLDEAQYHLEEALRLDPDNAEAHNGLGVFFLNAKQDVKGAYPFLLEALRLDPNDKDIRENFYLCLKATNPFYKLFWTVHQKVRAVPFWAYLLLLFAFKPFALFMIAYYYLVDPLFTKLIQWRIIK